MRYRVKSRTILLLIVLLACFLAAVDRARHSWWAGYYWRNYTGLGRNLPAARQYEAVLRAAGKVNEADRVRSNLAEMERMRNQAFWRWLKALVIDEP
jgi:hypothetical protein